jgi:hypothetical protein
MADPQIETRALQEQQQQQQQQQQQPSEAEARITEELAKDRPTIDAAVKSFISLTVARAMTATATDTTVSRRPGESTILGIVNAGIHNAESEHESHGAVAVVEPSSSTSSNSPSTQQQALQLARVILTSVNTYTFPIHDTVADTLAEKAGTTNDKRQELVERAVVAKLWNGLVQSNQKPSRFLGRRALKLAWKSLNVASNLKEMTPSSSASSSKDAAAGEDKSSSQSQVLDQQLGWLSDFERYLFVGDDGAAVVNDGVDDDSQLIWAADGGQAELSRRRQRRKDAATERGPSTPS